MAFYVGQFGNPAQGFDVIREYFDTDQKKSQFIAERTRGRNRIHGLRKAENLAELLYEWGYGYHSSDKSLEERTAEVYRGLASKFGRDKIEKHFPGESLDSKLFKRIEELYEKDFADESDDIGPPDYSRLERGQDINQDFPEDGDGGFWRIARDNG